MRLKSMIAVSAVVLTVALASPVTAQDAIPTEGEFALRYTWVNTTTSDFGAVARSDQEGDLALAGGWIAWLMTNDGSDGFGHKMTGRCSAFSRLAAGEFELVGGTCVYTDADGDQLFEQYDGLAGQWTGGTGKYAGISGSFELTDIVITAESGYDMLSGVKVGGYTLQ